MNEEGKDKMKIKVLCITGLMLLSFVNYTSEPTQNEAQRKILLSINRYNGPSALSTDGTYFINSRGQKCYVKRIAEEYTKGLRTEKR